jgi:hypothetical protein
MKNYRRLLLVALPLALVVSTHASWAAEKSSWDGVWKGSLGNISAISVTIANDKVVNYSFRGAPVKIAYDKITPAKISFGDPDHYKMTLVRTGDTTASAGYNGRRGYTTATLTKN